MENGARSFVDGREVAREIPAAATTVLLGECTHGTEEFYTLRAEITKYLIVHRKFRVVFCEADWPFLWHVNQYIHRKKTTMFPADVRFPDWMWRNRPFVELIEWMRNAQSHSTQCYLLGMDCYCKEESKQDLLKFLDKNDEELAKLFRQSCYPVERADMWPAILTKLQWERGSTSAGADDRYRGCSALDMFAAEQNLECMISADEYFTKQHLEPPGSEASWNARDQHMATTILRVKEACGKSKAKQGAFFPALDFADKHHDQTSEINVIVWAHNSHVGDATATPRGDVRADLQWGNEKWNLGW